MEHILPAGYLEDTVRVDLVGCGGNGSQMLSGLARLDAALRALGGHGLEVHAWDPDTVSAANVGRQLFSPADVGLNKATILIHRLNAFYGLTWTDHAEKYRVSGHSPCEPRVLVTCVDTAAARVEIGRNSKAFDTYWLDLGNREADGQVVLGELERAPRKEGAPPRLPTVLDLFWEVAQKVVPDDDAPSCSLAESLERQELFINQAVVTQALVILWTLFRFGRISWHGAFVNLRSGRVQPLPVDPQAWARMGYPRSGKGKR
jgi:PRTRC genetic system ThiF family protein